MPVDNTVTKSVSGMRWDFQKNIIMDNVRNHRTQFCDNTTKSISKGQILAIVNEIYDPLDLIRAKILIGKLWV